jgi:CheY-like chemotaxis protein
MRSNAESSYAPETAAPEAAYADAIQAPPAAAPNSAAPSKWDESKKILVLDDEPNLLNLYKRIIGRLPSRPQVSIVNNAALALAMLDAEPFDLFITDLRMPKIDGFQVLLSARRRLPDLKTVVVTGMVEEQYRTRAYESGIDLFVEKPITPAEFRIFGECIEELLRKGDKNRGFRGIQSKSLMDLVQFECLSQKSCVLKITSGSLEGTVWIANGNVIDAEAENLRGEDAFRHIFAWKAGNFELTPASPDRERTIFTSYEGLLLECAQILDETAATAEQTAHEKGREVALLASVRGVESVLLVGEDGQFEARGLMDPERLVTWTHRVLRDFQGIGDILKAGSLQSVQAAGRERGLLFLPHAGRQVMAGMDRKMTVKFIRKAGRELATHLGELIPEANDHPTHFPTGSYTITSDGRVLVTNLPSSFPRVKMEVIGKVMLSTLATARELDCPLTELAADFPGIEVRARADDGGAIIFITPQE